jgi:hypothetical protein
MNAGHRRRHTLRGTAAALAGLVLAAGCAEAPLAVEPPANLAMSGTELHPMFNPQPDPPMEMIRFSIDDPNLNPGSHPWRGEIRDATGRVLTLTISAVLPAVQRGQTLRLSQEWRFQDELLPAVQLTGHLNLASGRLVMNGRGSGGPVHAQGWLSVGSGGPGSIAGELMFNPQPDPPMPQP